MGISKLLFLLSLVGFQFPAGASDSSPTLSSPPLLIKDVTVIDGTPKQPYTATVLVEGNKITKILTGDIVPVSKATILDGRGKFLIPGLIETFAHISLRSHISGKLEPAQNETDLYRDIL